MNKKLLVILLAISIGINLYYFLSSDEASHASKITVDTVFINKPTLVDTIRLEKTVRIPIYLHSDSLKTGVTYDCSQIEKDSLKTKIDTMYINIPKEQKIYKDSLYKAWISGVEPNLDSIQIYNKTVTNYIKPKKPKISVNVGVYGGYGINGKNLDYGVGVMIGYPIWIK